MWIYVWVFNLIPFVNVSVFMPTSYCFYHYSSAVPFKIGENAASSNSFTIQDWFSYAGFSVFPCEPEICPFHFCEELCWSFEWDYIEYVDCFGMIAIFQTNPADP